MIVGVMFLVTIVFPAAFWWYFFIWQDRAEPEPKKLLIKILFLGMGAAIFAAAMEMLIFLIVFPEKYEAALNQIGEVTTIGIIALIIASIVEELIKFFAIKEFIYSKRDFNQIADGIFYAVALAIGFVIVENSFYFYSLYTEETLAVFISATMLRGISTALMHITSAGIIGYAFGRMKFSVGHSRKIVYKSLLFAIMLHVAFNMLVILDIMALEFIMVFAVFLYLLKKLKKQESKLVWRLENTKK